MKFLGYTDLLVLLLQYENTQTEKIKKQISQLKEAKKRFYKAFCKYYPQDSNFRLKPFSLEARRKIMQWKQNPSMIRKIQKQGSLDSLKAEAENYTCLRRKFQEESSNPVSDLCFANKTKRAFKEAVFDRFNNGKTDEMVIASLRPIEQNQELIQQWYQKFLKDLSADNEK